MVIVKSSDMTWIAVSDLNRSRAFFKKLGFKERVFSEEHGWSELVGNDGGSTIGLAHKSKSSPIQPGSNGVITLTVDNLNKAKKEFESLGMKMIGEVMEVPDHVKIQMFVDEDGNHFQIVELLGE